MPFPTDLPALIAQYGFPIVALLIVVGELGLPTPIPAEIALLLAGAQLIHSVPELIGAVALFGAVDTVSSGILHLVARSGGNRLFRRLLHRLQPGDADPAEQLTLWRTRLHGYDPFMIFVTRLVPVIRMYASLASGLIRIPVRHFFLGALPAALLWTGVPLTAGYLFRRQTGELSSAYTVGLHTALAVAAVLAMLALAARWTARRTGWPAGQREPQVSSPAS